MMGGGAVHEPDATDADVARYDRELEDVDWRDAQLGPELRDALKGAVHAGRPIELGQVGEVWQLGHIYLGEPGDEPWQISVGEHAKDRPPDNPEEQ